jgi:hypothetical protein
VVQNVRAWPTIKGEKLSSKGGPKYGPGRAHGNGKLNLTLLALAAYVNTLELKKKS